MKKSQLISPFAVLIDRPRDERNQKVPAERFVVHITGRMTYLNAMRRRVPPLEHLGQYFCMPGRPFTHYGIDPWSNLAQFSLENERPWAQGYGELRAKVLKQDIEPPDWWRTHWDDHQNIYHPTDFLIGNSKSPNSGSVTVELIQWNKSQKNKSNFKLTVAQYLMCHALAHDVAQRHRFSSELHCDFWPHFNICGHEDLNPWSRGTKAGGWDPGAHRVNGKPRFCWHCLETLDFTHGGQYSLCPAVIPTPPMPKWAMLP